MKNPCKRIDNRLLGIWLVHAAYVDLIPYLFRAADRLWRLLHARVSYLQDHSVTVFALITYNFVFGYKNKSILSNSWIGIYVI